MLSPKYYLVSDPETLTFLMAGPNSGAGLIREVAKARAAFSTFEMDDSVSEADLDRRSRNLAVVSNAIRTGNLPHAYEALQSFWSDTIAKDLPRTSSFSLGDAASVAAPAF